MQQNKSPIKLGKISIRDTWCGLPMCNYHRLALELWFTAIYNTRCHIWKRHDLTSGNNSVPIGQVWLCRTGVAAQNRCDCVEQVWLHRTDVTTQNRCDCLEQVWLCRSGGYIRDLVEAFVLVKMMSQNANLVINSSQSSFWSQSTHEIFNTPVKHIFPLTPADFFMRY